MSYLGSWKVDGYLTFCCNTHDPDTGVGTDADSVPTYLVYEDETGTAILTGSMALLDAANTTGFYSERIQLTAASGFEKGKCYTIYITATVDADTGTMHHNFQIEAAMGGGAITFIYTLTSSVDAAPIAQADVWITTDAAGSNVIASGTTSDTGTVTFYLDAGTYYIWRAKSGWVFENPDTEVIA